MASIVDDRGFNQGFKPSKTLALRTKRRADYILSKIDHTKNGDILEIGCGLGDLSFIIAQSCQSKVLGTDLCVPFIENAQKNYSLPNLQYDVIDFNKPEKLKGRKFDYIIGNGILHHLYYDLDNALFNLKSLLKDDGIIIFLEPNLLNPYCYLIFNTIPFFRKWAKLEPTEMAFTRSFITKKLKNIGYQNINVKYKDFLVPGIPYLLSKPIILIGSIVEKIPVFRSLAQSIFIDAKN